MNIDELVRLRLRNQRLAGERFARAEEVVEWLCAVQSQDYPGAKWGVGQRVAGCVDGDVEEAYNSGLILRTHVLRPTWHFVRPADIRWMLELTAPRIKRALSYYDSQLGLSEEVYAQTNRVMVKALGRGEHLTRKELGDALEAAGIEARGQRLGHIALRAEVEGLICSGANRGKTQTYALVDQRAPGARRLKREEALGELARRYFASHGPALAQDFAWWSGLAVADARKGMAMNQPGLANERVDEKEFWYFPGETAPAIKNPTVHLLPNYDEHLVAYRNHDASVNASMLKDVSNLNELFARHVIVLNGRAIGGWKTATDKGAVVVDARLPRAVSKATVRAVEAEVKQYAEFLGVEVEMRLAVGDYLRYGFPPPRE